MTRLARPLAAAEARPEQQDGRMLNQQRINAVEYEMSLIDEEIARLYAKGDRAEADRLLDRRAELQQQRWALSIGLAPNG